MNDREHHPVHPHDPYTGWKVWVVYGECGEYSDARWWPVRSFSSSGMAAAEAERLNAWVAEQKLKDQALNEKEWVGCWWEGSDARGWEPKAPPGDPSFLEHHWGGDTLKYTVIEVPHG